MLFLCFQYIDDREYIDDETIDEEVYGRNKFQLNKRLPFNKFNQKKVQDDARQISLLPTRSTVTAVTTSYASTSTVIISSTATCYGTNYKDISITTKILFHSNFVQISIAKTLFSQGAAPCRRRRREAKEILESINPTSNINK